MGVISKVLPYNFAIGGTCGSSFVLCLEPILPRLVYFLRGRGINFWMSVSEAILVARSSLRLSIVVISIATLFVHLTPKRACMPLDMRIAFTWEVTRNKIYEDLIHPFVECFLHGGKIVSA